MDSWTDTPGDWLALLSIASIIIGALVWLIRMVALQGRQYRPNGGDSMRDILDTSLRRNTEDHDRLIGRIERLEENLHTHRVDTGAHNRRSTDPKE